jgi:hypothetical protein
LDQLSKNKRNSKELTLIQYVCEKEKDRLSATNILWITPPNISSYFFLNCEFGGDPKECTRSVVAVACECCERIRLLAHCHTINNKEEINTGPALGGLRSTAFPFHFSFPWHA